MVLRSARGTAPAAGAPRADRLALWVVPVAELGGVARHVLDAMRAGIPGWRVVVLCPDGPLAEALRALGTPVLTGAVSKADGTATAVRTIRRTLGRLRPDVLHTHLAFADLAGIAAVTGLRSGSGRRIRVVSTEHGISGVRGLYHAAAAQIRIMESAHRARLTRTDRVIAVSDSTAHQIATQWGSARRITVIRNGVDVPSPAPEQTQGLRFLSLARLAPEKRIDRLLGAFDLVVREHPTATLTVAGSGPDAEALHARAAELELDDRVTFPGHLDPGTALREHDVVVQLSAWENLSYTLLDAVTHGLGVVATDVGGNREIVPARCLVDAGDLRAVATAMVAQGEEISARPARRTTQTVRAMCDAIETVYREVTP